MCEKTFLENEYNSIHFQDINRFETSKENLTIEDYVQDVIKIQSLQIIKFKKILILIKLVKMILLPKIMDKMKIKLYQIFSLEKSILKNCPKTGQKIKTRFPIYMKRMIQHF